jgi:putative acetyltransferase
MNKTNLWKENSMIVENVFPEYYQEMLDLWENSVRATHDFVTEEDIDFFKPIIIDQAFPAVTLKCIKDAKGSILGFVGIHDLKVEMLFVLARLRGKGIGRLLLQYAIDNYNSSFGVHF